MALESQNLWPRPFAQQALQGSEFLGPLHLWLLHRGYGFPAAMLF